jgi:hypothetical protein
MNAGAGARLCPLRGLPGWKINHRIGIKVGAHDGRATSGAFWRLEALQFVTQRAVALLWRVKVGEPLSGIRRGGRLPERRVRIGEARGREDERRNPRGSNARPGRLFGVSHHRRGDGGFSFGERVRLEAGLQVARQREG